MMLMHLSIPLGISEISTSKLFSSLKIMCPSYPCKLWKIIGSFSLVIINLLLKYYLVICLVHFCLFSTHLINLLIQSLPLKIIERKVNLSSIHTNFAHIELG